MGIGYWPGAGMTMVGIYNSPFEDHVLPHGVHMDERWRIPSDDYNLNGDYLQFITEFHGKKKTPEITAETVYLLYDGAAHQMTRFIGDESAGFYRLNFGIGGLQTCKPYAFIVVDNNGDYHRLPEDDNYFFATYNDPHDEIPGICNENHYFWNEDEWIANASPRYQGSGTNCTGCSEIDILVNIWKQFLGPTPAPTSAPTVAPSGW